MKLRDFSLEKLDELVKLERADLRYLWHSEYWDGPKNGILTYKGRKYWFDTFDEPDTKDIFRRFIVIELSPEQLAEEEKWHELFREKVGLHTDYDEDQRRPIGMLKPQELHPEFYEAYKNRNPRDFRDNEIVAWYEV